MEIDLKSFDFYVVSLSPRTVTYKGMIMSDSLNEFTWILMTIYLFHL